MENGKVTNKDVQQLLGVKDSRALKILKELAVVKTSSGKMFLPGGKIEDGESTEDCVVRECLEEMGAKVTVKQYFALGERYFYHEASGRYSHVIGHFFYSDGYSDAIVHHFRKFRAPQYVRTYICFGCVKYIWKSNFCKGCYRTAKWLCP